jgi:hypothetical protein
MTMIVSDEQMSAFEARMREKEKREVEEAREEMRKTAREISNYFPVHVAPKPAATSDGMIYEATCSEFPGAICYRATPEDAERDLRKQIEEVAFGRIERGADPYTGEISAETTVETDAEATTEVTEEESN